jgi:hypothetical protein
MIENKGEIIYWRSMHNEVDEELKNIQGIVLAFHNSMEFIQCIDFFNKIKSNHFTNVLYISLTRSYDYMRHALEQKPLDQKRILFIDCVSGFAFPAEENIDTCLYHKPPRDLQAMKEIIQFGINKINPDIIIIDSLSQLINFSKPTEQELDEFYTFLHDMRQQMLNLVNNTIIFMFDIKMGVIFQPPTHGFNMILKMEIPTPKLFSPNDRLSFREKIQRSSMIL